MSYAKASHGFTGRDAAKNLRNRLATYNAEKRKKREVASC
jgi:hypothetical protein